MTTVEANGLSFHVQTLGEGPPVVMIHGLFFGNLAAWYFHIAPRLAVDHEVFLYDTRGHGRSAHAKDGYDLRTMTDDLEALVARYGETPLDLVGHSFGALTSLRFALDHPERVRRLVLIETPLPPHSLAETDDLLPFTSASMRDVFKPEFLRSQLAERKDAAQILDALPASISGSLLKGRRGIERIARNLAHLMTDSTLLHDLRAEQDIPDEELRTVRQPALVVRGSQSKLHGVADRLVDVLPDASLVELEGGHYLVNERPRELGDAIEAFLRST